jgi:hypothetical protein
MGEGYNKEIDSQRERKNGCIKRYLLLNGMKERKLKLP